MSEVETHTLKILILASGTGTLMESILDNVQDTVQVLAVGSDRPCQALDRAHTRGVPTFLEHYRPEAAQDPRSYREQWNRNLQIQLEKYDPDLIVSAGFMRILGTEIVERFSGKIINTHPALLPSFPGAHAVDDALNYGVTITGTTVHLVDSGLDTGPIIAQCAVPVYKEDTRDSLHERIKEEERRLIVEVIHSIAAHGIRIEGRRVSIS